MTQRVRRAERLKRHRGFIYRRPCGNLADAFKALYPGGDTRPPQDWPSAATVEVTMLVGRTFARRPVTLLVRVPKSKSEAEAKSRARSKMRLSEWDAWQLVKLGPVKPDGVPAVPPITELLYRDDPFSRMLKREVSNG